MPVYTPSPKPRYPDPVEEVVSGAGVSPPDLPPLYDSIGSDTFASLRSPEAESVSLLFTYSGYDDIVDGEGHVTVGSAD